MMNVLPCGSVDEFNDLSRSPSLRAVGSDTGKAQLTSASGTPLSVSTLLRPRMTGKIS